jgi:hypothetical protein
MKLGDFARGTVAVPLWFKANGTRGREGDGDSERAVFHLRVFLNRDASLFDDDDAKDPKKFLAKAVARVEGFDDLADEKLTEETASNVPQWATILLMQEATKLVQLSEDEEGNSETRSPTS